MLKRILIDAALLPVTVPLSILDWVQPLDDVAGWPALIVLP